MHGKYDKNTTRINPKESAKVQVLCVRGQEEKVYLGVNDWCVPCAFSMAKYTVCFVNEVWRWF